MHFISSDTDSKLSMFSRDLGPETFVSCSVLRTKDKIRSYHGVIDMLEHSYGEHAFINRGN